MGSLGVDDAVAAARGGDKAAFERLVRETYSGVFTLAARITGNRDDAADVAQEAYIRAYRGLVDFRGESRFTTWLHRITVNCANTLLVRRNANLSHRRSVLVVLENKHQLTTKMSLLAQIDLH